MRILLTSLLIALFLQGCFSIKSEYPEIEYYRLEQKASSLTNSAPMDGTLQIRDFTVSNDLETDHLLALENSTKIKKYYYHRWITDCQALVTDFFINRYNTLQSFKGSVVKSSTVLVPNYIMEAQILDMIAHNREEGSGSNFVFVSLQVTLLERIPLNPERKIVLSKEYTSKIPRPDNSVKSIPGAFSQAISEVADNVLNDIQQAISKYEKTDKE